MGGGDLFLPVLGQSVMKLNMLSFTEKIPTVVCLCCHVYAS